MDIIIHSLGMPFDGDTVATQSLGGSESAAYYQAIELAKRGHRVMVFNASQQPSEKDGVKYYPAGQCTREHPLGDQFDYYATTTPHDVLIIQRHPLAFHKRYASKVNVWQLHDLAQYRSAGAVNGMLHNITFVTVVSEWHKQQVCKVYGLDPARVHVVRNGVDPELYEKEYVANDREPTGVTAGIALHEQNKFVMLYQSRPERGLEHLVRPGGIMDRLRDTKAHLLYCAYANTVPQMQGYYAQLDAWAKALPNVANLGALTKPQLAALQKSCDLLCYPTEFEEVSCITAMEAMHARLPMLTSAVGALPETCEQTGTQLIPLKDGKAYEDAFVEWIKSAIDDDVHPISGLPKVLDKMRNIQEVSAENYTWPLAVDALESAIKENTAPTNVRNAIDHADIDSARVLLKDAESEAQEAGESVSEIEEYAANELNELYRFTNSPEEYAAHYAKHQAAYYDGHEQNVIGEDVTRTTRFQGVMQIIGSYIMRSPGQKLRILDYGCAHGHYMVPLAKMFPQCEFVGVDISARAVAAATKWIYQEQLTNCSVVQGTEATLDPANVICNKGLFDVVYAGEVVEHVVDDMALLRRLQSICMRGAMLCISTPYGRWEWQGTEAYRTGREHIHHYERSTILQLCGTHKVELLYAPAGHDRAGGQLGSWVWGVELVGEWGMKPTVQILPPRQTLSACLIVKDGETTLRKCISSFIDAVDEVIVAIDPKTTDRTRAVLESIQIDFPYKPIVILDGISATEHGFDAARNLTIKAASGDWIMWCDADEEVQNAYELWKYLRPSMIDAVGFPQIHYSTDPPRVLTTDYPCRLFRNKLGVQFYGVVHEHPELAPGTGIPQSAMRGEVAFLHNGYVNERVRRERFQRNLPLLMQDREKYPNRKLNRFLMLRDIAQGLAFELEQTGGAVYSGQPERAQEGIDIWREMLKKDPVRMCIDAQQYYSQCVNILNIGFESGFEFKSSTPHAPDLAVTLSVQGRFSNQQDLKDLHSKIIEEATAKYEEPYL